MAGIPGDGNVFLAKRLLTRSKRIINSFRGVGTKIKKGRQHSVVERWKASEGKRGDRMEPYFLESYFDWFVLEVTL
jgi:hypothetical protein